MRGRGLAEFLLEALGEVFLRAEVQAVGYLGDAAVLLEKHRGGVLQLDIFDEVTRRHPGELREPPVQCSFC